MLFTLAGLISCESDEYPFKTIQPVTIAESQLNGAGAEGIEKQNLVITNTADWYSLIRRMDSSMSIIYYFKESDIDFSEYTVLASFDEVRSSGGYKVRISKVVEYSGSINCTVEYESPTGIVTANLNQPFHIVKIPKSNKQIVFN